MKTLNVDVWTSHAWAHGHSYSYAHTEAHTQCPTVGKQSTCIGRLLVAEHYERFLGQEVVKAL